MAGIVIVDKTTTVHIHFGDYKQQYEYNEEGEIAKCSIEGVYLKYNDLSQRWVSLVFKNEKNFQLYFGTVDTIDGVAPTSVDDLYDKLCLIFRTRS